MLAVNIAKTNMATSQTVDVRVILEPFPKLNKLKDIKILYFFTLHLHSVDLWTSYLTSNCLRNLR